MGEKEKKLINDRSMGLSVKNAGQAAQAESRSAQGADRGEQAADQPAQGADRGEQAADQPAQGADRGEQAAYRSAQGADRGEQAAYHPAQGADTGAQAVFRAAQQPLPAAVGCPQGTDGGNAWSVPNPAIQPNLRPVQPSVTDTEYTRRMKEGFGFFAPAALIYACFYAFCTYKNPSGVTFPFFIAGSLLFFSLCISKLEISLKKGSAFYMISIMLLGVSTFCTDDARIILLNKTGIFLLMVSLLLEQMYDTSSWKLGKFLGSIITVTFASLGELGRPFSDAARYRKGKGGGRRGRAFDIMIGLIIGVPLVLVVGAILGSADVVFRQMVNRLMEAVRPEDLFLVTLRVVFLFFASYCGLSYLCRRRLKETVPDKRNGEPVLAITVCSILTALYLIFSVIQILFLFLGRFRLPEDYTYAMYAREGFFQLLAVSVLNLIIVLLMLGRFKESRVLKGILTLMSLCTFVMIASSAMRMVMYIRYYDLTFLRIFVLWSLAVLFLLFSGVIANIFRERFPLFRYSAAVVTVCFLALSFSHPDYWIAKMNTAARGEEELEYLDYRFLAGLSTDAAPALLEAADKMGYDFAAAAGKLEEENDRVDQGERPASLRDVMEDSASEQEGFITYWLIRLRDRTEDMGWRTFNISRYMAGKAAESRMR